MKPRAILFGATALLAIVGAAIVGLGWLTPYTNHYVRGADVSRHQGPIDWKALAATDVRFVYIKASEGADHRDDRFNANWRDAGAAGLKRGAYHFFTLCRPGAAQAANFIAAVPRADGALPPAVDIEQKFPCRRGPTMTDVPGELKTFLDIAEAHYGARPLVYTTGEFERAHLQGALKGERFWLRALLGQPDFRRNEWVLWQYDHDAKRPGISGKLDLNYFRGDEKAFEAFAADAQAGRS
jgi:lysozyme